MRSQTKVLLAREQGLLEEEQHVVKSSLNIASKRMKEADEEIANVTEMLQLKKTDKVKTDNVLEEEKMNSMEGMNLDSTYSGNWTNLEEDS
jgi:hypothetical protein